MFLRSLMIAGALALSSISAQAELNDDGLHVAPWLMETFRDMREDLEEATANGQRLAVIIEQRGCIYCTKMHNEVYPREEVSNYIRDNFFVVQLNLYGDTEITDFDGEVLTEKAAAQKWGLLFTPSILFMLKVCLRDKEALFSFSLQFSGEPETAMPIFFPVL